MYADERKMLILSAVVDEYIKTGEPVASNSIIKKLPIHVSSATVRNDMAALEHVGYLEQPHTSAGRVPTYLGYRFYIDNLMRPKPLSTKEKHLIDSLLTKKDLTVDAVVDNAVNVLSDLTQLAVVSKNSMPVFSVITRVEVIPAGRKLYALLIITSAGTIKNKICRIEFDLSYEQIDYFAKFINQNLNGRNLDDITPEMVDDLAMALGTYMVSLSPLLNAVYELSDEMSKTSVNLKGEQRLITSGIKADEVVSLMAHKNDLDSVLSKAFDGISIVFGEEHDSFAVTNSSMIMSPYKVGNKQVGSIGVIGPLTIDYANVIPHIEYITKSVTKLLADVIEGDDGKDETKNE